MTPVPYRNIETEKNIKRLDVAITQFLGMSTDLSKRKLAMISGLDLYLMVQANFIEILGQNNQVHIYEHLLSNFEPKTGNFKQLSPLANGRIGGYALFNILTNKEGQDWSWGNDPQNLSLNYKKAYLMLEKWGQQN